MSDTRTAGLRATLGTPYKLISPRGTLLGILTVPDHVADILRKHHAAQFMVQMVRDFVPYERFFKDAPPTVTVRVGTISRTHYAAFYRDGVHLYGIAIEDLEQQPGWSFAPGAGYLRSLMAD